MKDRKKKKKSGGMKEMEWRREVKIEEGFSSWLLGPDHVWNLLWTPGGVQSPVKWSNKEINAQVERKGWREWKEKEEEKADRETDK